jgi:crotonobetainyl-CoA:carnitine CoA-transferase CaiB-like acyl-CoA transferase
MCATTNTPHIDLIQKVTMQRSGPLSHLTVIKFAGLGPAPFAAMTLADQGARVIRIDCPSKRGSKGAGMDALLTALIQGCRSSGLWNAEAGTNNGGSGVHFYDGYACADGKHISIGAMESRASGGLRHTRPIA